MVRAGRAAANSVRDRSLARPERWDRGHCEADGPLAGSGKALRDEPIASEEDQTGQGCLHRLWQRQGRLLHLRHPMELTGRIPRAGVASSVGTALRPSEVGVVASGHGRMGRRPASTVRRCRPPPAPGACINADADAGLSSCCCGTAAGRSGVLQEGCRSRTVETDAARKASDGRIRQLLAGMRGGAPRVGSAPAGLPVRRSVETSYRAATPGIRDDPGRLRLGALRCCRRDRGAPGCR